MILTYATDITHQTNPPQKKPKKINLTGRDYLAANLA